MSNQFKIKKQGKSEESFFDRQERISGWDQEALKNARVLVIGAGAIGNETLKNLALLGVGNIYIADFDVVSASNLSRSVLFGKSDTGKKKAEVAAKKVKRLALEESSRVFWFHGDVVWELGTGTFRSMDVVLGCLDNVETRLAVNKQCYLSNTPWIDSGIYELGGHVSVFTPPKLPCYQCGATKEQIESARRRYSCDDFKKAVINEGKMPTVQVTSSIISAIQVQEAIKILSGGKVEHGKKIYFQGRSNDFDILGFTEKPNCTGHPQYPSIIDLPLTNLSTLRDLLGLVSKEEYSGHGATLDLRGDREFVYSISCKTCSKKIRICRPSFKVLDTEASSKVSVSEFSLENSDNQLLGMTLQNLGIPDRHVLAVHDTAGNYKYYELYEGNPFKEA